MIIMVIPVHHIQFLRYPKPSPAALPCFLVADSNPFFLITKLRSVSVDR